jgi:hypothetical protein
LSLREYYENEPGIAHCMVKVRERCESRRVVFRLDATGEVTAVFPDILHSPGHVTCYAHIGQHGGCSWDWYRRTWPAAPHEYASLLAELRGIYESEANYVRLDVRKRIQR